MNEFDLVWPRLLATKLRYVTARQDVALRGVSSEQSRRDFERLHRDGWLGSRPLSERLPAGKHALTAPIAVRERGGPVPDLRAVAHKLASRRRRPERGVAAYYATELAVSLVGGVKPDLSWDHQPYHALAITDLFIAVSKSRPHLAASWLGGDAFRIARPAAARIPSAVAFDEDGSLRAFEYGSESFDLKRLVDFDRGCEQLEVFQWEIW